MIREMKIAAILPCRRFRFRKLREGIDLEGLLWIPSLKYFPQHLAFAVCVIVTRGLGKKPKASLRIEVTGTTSVTLAKPQDLFLGGGFAIAAFDVDVFLKRPGTIRMTASVEGARSVSASWVVTHHGRPS
jgi:hypothetical protein